MPKERSAIDGDGSMVQKEEEEWGRG